MPITNEITVIIAFAGYHAFEASAFIDGRENLCRCRRVLAIIVLRTLKAPAWAPIENPSSRLYVFLVVNIYVIYGEFNERRPSSVLRSRWLEAISSYEFAMRVLQQLFNPSLWRD